MPIQVIRCGLMLALCFGAVSFPGVSVAQSDPSKAFATAAPVNVRLHLVLKDESPVMGAEVSVKGDKIERTARSDSGAALDVSGFAS